LPGLGERGQLRASTRQVSIRRETYPDLVVLPAHDPGAAARLAAVERAGRVPNR
jgi:N-acyl homoserine lactone hydrolase